MSFDNVWNLNPNLILFSPPYAIHLIKTYNIMQIIIFFSIIFKLVLSSIPVPCAKNCTQACAQPSSSCFSCLQYFFQKYNLQTSSCECRDNYEPAQNIKQFCCPFVCRSCGPYGCTSCWKNGYISIEPASRDTSCVCQENYFTNITIRYCVCRSEILPREYYNDEELDICLKCPQNCTCTEYGCVQCSHLTNRVMRINKYNISTCHCIGDFLQINGKCWCPIDCICEQSKIISCSISSHRRYSDGSWQCPERYTDLNGECICQMQHYRIFQTTNPYNQQQCLCDSRSPSIVLDENEYEVKDECRECIHVCDCDETGCYACEESPSTVSIDHVCHCINNFTYTYGLCQCEMPFYWVQEHQYHYDNLCYCLSQKYPTKYYYIQQSQSCLRCPEGCTCNQTGCVSCSPGLLRQIRVFQNGRSSCQCSEHSQPTQQNTCVCYYMFRYDPQSQSCVCDLAKRDFSFQDVDMGACEICPKGCQCDEKGCHSCVKDLLRVVRINSIGRYTCYCRDEVIQNNQGFCKCQHPLVWNSTKEKCQCKYPYYLNQHHQCVCSSLLNSTKYYFDPLTQICYQCPFNCICNSSGCIQCSEDSLRFVMKTSLTLYICRCKTFAFFIDNLCLNCPITSYYYSGDCIPCVECLTCDKRGCLSCTENLVLVNFSCVCSNNLLMNFAGECVCLEGYYYHHYKKQCEACPIFCHQCRSQITPEILQQSVVCLSCSPFTHRNQDPKSNCKCQQGYAQVHPQQQTCCPLLCSSCNYTTCFSCNPYTNKIIKDGQCVCPQLMTDYDGTCGCQTGYYLFDEQCLVCMKGCKSCYFDYMLGLNLCVSCKEDMNRNLSSMTCQCLTGYQETQFVKSQFCVAKFCKRDEINCSECIVPYVKMQDLCICPPGSYRSGTRKCLLCEKHPGCLQCKNLSYCLRCDENRGYFLTFPKCVELNVIDHILVANQTNTIVQFRVDQDEIVGLVKAKSLFVRSIYSEIDYNYNHTEDEKKQHQSMLLSYYFENYQVIVANSIITIAISLPISFSICFLTIQGTFSTLSTLQTNQLLNKSYNLKTTLDLKTSPLTLQQTILLKIIAVTSLISSYIIYIAGYKNNQLIFLFQTASFLGFKLNETLLSNIYICYDLRYIYYNFDKQVFKSASFNLNYEESKGNYYFLTYDHSIFRVLGVNMSIAFLNLVVLFIMFIFFLVNLELIIYLKKLHYSRFFFRTIQFLYKTTMYPLIFFSLQNILDWNRESYYNTQIIKISNIFSVIILSIYVFTTVIEYTSILTSNFYKRISVVQIASGIICSITLILSGDRVLYFIPVLVVIVIGKNAFYYYFRYLYLKDHCCFSTWNYIPFLIQGAVLVTLIYDVRVYGVIILLGGLIVAEVLVFFFIVKNYNKEGNFDKQKGFMKSEPGIGDETKNTVFETKRGRSESQQKIHGGSDKNISI